MANRKKNKRNFSSIIPKKVKNETSLYLSLKDDNFFPPWFEFGSFAKTGQITLPLSKKKASMTLQEYKRSALDKYGHDYLESFRDGYITGNVHVFQFDRFPVGQDKDYIYNLSEIVVTESMTIDNKFVLVLFINTIIRPSRKKFMEDHFRKKIYEHEILCPIWQFGD